MGSRSRVPSELTRTISRPLESAIHTPSPADRVDGPAPAGIVASTLPSSGLSRKTTSSGTIETHTESRSTARSVTVPCSGVTAVMRFVTGSILTIRPFSEPATQTLSPAKTTDVVDSGVGKRCSTAPLAGATRTVSDARATQTEPAPKATPVGLRLLSPLAGMENRCAIAPVVPSSRTSPSPPSSVTQAPPPPVAMPPGTNGSVAVDRILRDAMSTRATRRSSPRSTQASASVNATSQGWLAKGMPPTTSCERASIRPSDFGGISSRAGAAASPPPRRTRTPTRAAAATATPASAQRARRRPAGARRGGASPRSAAAAAVASAPQLANRSSGAFAMAVATTASNAAGTSGRTSLASGGGSCMWA